VSRVELVAIAIDAGTQVRAAINEATVADYAEQMTNGVQFPAIVLFHDGNQYYLADGFHRVMAAKRNDWREIDADVHPGTKTDALWFALGANKANGERLTPADKKHAIVLALQTWGAAKSLRSIAAQIGMPFSTAQYHASREAQVTNLGQPILNRNRVTGKDGKNYSASRPVTRDREEQQPHPKAAEIETRLRAGETIDAIRKALHVDYIAVAEVRKTAGLKYVDKSPASVAARRKDISDMAERGFTTRQIAAALPLSEEGVRAIAKKHGISIHADRVAGGTRRHDANRIVEQIVIAAENLTAGVELIALKDIDRAQLPSWIESLTRSRQALSSFIRLLQQESKRHEAA
jgi:hypothetical protein